MSRGTNSALFPPLTLVRQKCAQDAQTLTKNLSENLPQAGSLRHEKRLDWLKGEWERAKLIASGLELSFDATDAKPKAEEALISAGAASANADKQTDAVSVANADEAYNNAAIAIRRFLIYLEDCEPLEAPEAENAEGTEEESAEPEAKEAREAPEPEPAPDPEAPLTEKDIATVLTKMIEQGRVVEPLRDLYKIEVRELGRALGLDPASIERHPFPGPGLGIRVAAATSVEDFD